MAYLELQKSPNDNKRALVAFVLSLAFLVLAFKCSGQCVQRTRPFFNSDSTRFIACTSLNFGVVNANGEEENINFGILSDSLPNNSYSYVITVWFPVKNKIVSAEIDFGFNKLGIKTISSTFINPDVGYAEFRLSKEQAVLLRDNLYEYINFRVNGNNLSYAEDWVLDPYVSNFLKIF